MTEKLREAIYGKKSPEDLYNIAYDYAHADFVDLTGFLEDRAHFDRLCIALKKERKRLERINSGIRFFNRIDRILKTNSTGIFRLILMRNALIRYCRYASLRDRGEDKSRGEIKQIKKVLRTYLTNTKNLKNIRSGKDFFSIDRLVSACMVFAPVEESQLEFVDEYIRDFLKICPGRYLRKGSFAKVIGSFFGLMKYGYEDPGTDYDEKIRLGIYFGTTYLFDDILDDPEYSEHDKRAYFRNITSILRGCKEDPVVQSGDPLMAFSESAFVVMREILDEKRWRAVADSYIVLAMACGKGAEWNFDECITDGEIYTISNIKGSYTRIIPGILAYRETGDQFLSVCIRTGYIYQMADDLRDIHTDITENTPSSFTYYMDGACRPEYHPLDILLGSIGKLAYIDHGGVHDADRLYLQSVIFSVKALLKTKRSGNFPEDLSGMIFPDERIREEFIRIGELHEAIIDPETELAEIITSASLEMKKQTEGFISERI